MRSPAAIIASAVLIVIADALPGLLIGSFAGEIRTDLGLSTSGLGLAAAVFWLAAAVGSAPGGRFVDRFGATRGIHVGGALAALGAAAAVAAPRIAVAGAAAAPRSRFPRRRALLLFAGGAFAANAAAGAALTFLVSYGVEIGFSAGAAGALLAAASGSAVAVRLGLGVLVDHRPDAAPRWITAQLIGGAAGHVLLTTATPALVAAGAIVAVALGWGWAGLLLFAVVRHSRGEPGAAVGVVAAGFFSGAVLGPLGAGLTADLASFELVWWLCVVLSVLGAAAIHAGARALRA